MTSTMRWVKLLGGVVLLLVGLLWVLQGVDVLGGSSMSGQTQWLIIGAVVAIVGVWLISGGVRGDARR